MSYAFPPDVAKLIHEQMTTRGYASEDDVLRDALAALGHFAWDPAEIDEEYQQTVAAVKEGIADMEAGRMRKLRDLLGGSEQGGKQAEKP